MQWIILLILESTSLSIIITMIDYSSTIEAMLYCLIFFAAILFSEAVIDYQKTYCVPHQSKIKISILLGATILMTLSVYTTHCHGEIGFLECIYINPG